MGNCAPHKPLLLLVFCDMAEQGIISGTVLPLSAELASRFASYWTIVAQRRSQRPDIRLPFYHLIGDGIWKPLDQAGRPSTHRNLTRFAELPSDLIAFVSDPVSRDKARHLLIAKYFPPSERIALYEAIGLPIPSPVEIEKNAAYKSPEAAKLVGREARFRVVVLAAYDYTCALTRYRLTTVSGASLVDAAHIHQFADSRNNDFRNGIALSKSAHWLFDQGLWSLSDDYRVIVAIGAFKEQASEPAHLLERLHGTKIMLPGDRSLWPNPLHLAWHRSKKMVVA
jgi:putative restriction endonuclease